MKIKKLSIFVLSATIIGISACSSPSATICGVQVREGEKTKIRANKEVLIALNDMDEASKKSRPSIVTINIDSNASSVLPLFRSAGLGSDGTSVILRNAKAYQEFAGGAVLLELSCDK